MITALINDIKYAFRQLRKSPGFTAIALVTLAIGIGANTIMFSIVDTLMFRPAKVREPEQLVLCRFNDFLSDKSYPVYQLIRDSKPVFSEVMAQDSYFYEATLMSEGISRKVSATYVSSNYFSFLGVTPIIGRGFLPEEEKQDALPVVVLSYYIWQKLGGDPMIVGKDVYINSVRCQVVGVAPEGFCGITITAPSIWLSAGSYLAVEMLSKGITIRDELRERFYPSLSTIGRLKPGMSMAVAQVQLQSLIPLFKENYPERWSSSSSLYLQKPGRAFVEEDIQTVFPVFSLVLMIVSATILIIACMNLANMLIIQNAGRHREIAIRLALGSGRWHIIRQLLIESLLLSLLGGAFGLVLAFWGTRILNVWVEASNLVELVNMKTGFSIRVLEATVGFIMVTAVLFGLRPAIGLSRSDLITELKESGSAMFLPIRRKRSNLSVFFQIALAVVLVMCAALLIRSSLLTIQPNPGFRMDNKLIVEVDPHSAGYESLRSIEVCESLADQLSLLPEIEALGTSNNFFFGGGGVMSISEYTPDNENSESRKSLADYALCAEVGRDYFSAMEIPLLHGRPFNRLDSAPGSEKVAIIDESLAHKIRPDGMALGSLIQYKLIVSSEYSEPYRVVGIVPNIQGVSDSQGIRSQMYRPAQQESLNQCLYLRLTDAKSAGVLQQRITEEIRKFDPSLPIVSVKTLAEKHHDNPWVWLWKMGARLGIMAGVTALFLAALGIYAVEGYLVASRTNEIGIRIALGATRRDILFMVLRKGIVLTLVGLFTGLLLAFAAAWVIRSVFYGINPVDPISIIVTIVMLGFASLLASYIPARRGARLDPMNALRYE